MFPRVQELSWSAILVAILLCGCSSSGGGTAGLPFEPAGPDAAPDPMQPGPFQVGVRTVTLVDESRPDPDTGAPRTLLTEVWYPAEQAAADGPFWSYDAKAEVTPESLGDKYEAFMAADLPLVTTNTVRDAELDRTHGPYPVILPWEQAHPVINHYATALFHAHLRDSTGSLELLRERDDPPFDTARFFTGSVPDFADGGCGN